MDYAFLQHYWWFIIALLGGLLVFLLFVQGGQTLLYQVGKTQLEQTMLINTLGRKWEFTFTTLVTFGGALFAAFPLYYATSFGGAYWLWMLILFCFIIQAVSYEYRMKKGNLLGQRTYEAFLMINGVGGLVFLGVAVGMFFTGGDFLINKSNLANPGNPVIASWANPWHGLEAILNIQNLLLGLTLFFLARTQAALYFINSIDHEAIVLRARQHMKRNAVPFLLLFVGFVVTLLLQDGLQYDPSVEQLTLRPYHYALSLLEMPVVMLLLLAGVILVVTGILLSWIKPSFRKGIWLSGSGTILTVLSVLLLAGWNQTAFFPSTIDPQASLTLANASSSFFTLKVMSIVSLIIPFVGAYIFYAWRVMNRQPLTSAEMQEPGHKY